MPEGHSVHRVALQLGADFVGRRVAASSPQGRFAAGAALLDGLVMVGAFAVGKHLLAAFEAADDGPSGSRPAARAQASGRAASDESLRQALAARPDARWLRVHLGLYGAWDFHGVVSPIGRNAYGVGSIGAPRLRRAVRIGEQETELAEGGPVADAGPDAAAVPDAAGGPDAVVGEVFPPEPVGQVRLRLLTDESVADLRGPSRCEVVDPAGVAELMDKAGPDPRVDWWDDPEGTFVERLRRRRVAVGQLLMDQSVISGIGNIYRAEMLFRAQLDPFTPGNQVPADVARELWRDWARLLDLGIETGVILVREDHDARQQEAAISDRSIRFAVYGRAGEPCYRCGTPVALADMAGRKLFWSPGCQV